MKDIFKWEQEPNGCCPVQATGWFLGFFFYFRARHETAEILFYKDKSQFHYGYPIWQKTLEITKPYKAGFLKKWYCKLLIFKGCLISIFKI